MKPFASDVARTLVSAGAETLLGAGERSSPPVELRSTSGGSSGRLLGVGSFVGQPILAVRMGLRPMKGDENLERPITNRPQDAILPNMRLSSQDEAFDRAAGFQPASSMYDEFLGLSLRGPWKHTGRKNPFVWDCWSVQFGKPPERRLQARLPAPLLNHLR